MDRHPPGSRRLPRGRRVVQHAVWLTILWLVLARGEAGSLTMGAAFVVAACAISLRVPPTGVHQRPAGAVRFAGVFLGRCLVAGIDVARRALGPEALLRPGRVTYRLSLPSFSARAFLASAVSLLPGTMSTRLDGDLLELHVLDRTAPVEAEIARLEQLVAGIFVTLEDQR